MAEYNIRAIELNRLGAELVQKGDIEGAKWHFKTAYQLDPNFLPPLANLAIQYSAENHLQVSASILRRIAAFCPDDVNILNSLGNILTRLEYFDEAETVLQRCVKLGGEDPGVWQNLALWAHRSGRHKLAVEYIERVEALGHRSPVVANDKAHFLLAAGESLQTALGLYEARWGVGTLPHLAPWDYHVPEWKGEPLKGASILFHGEQGYGDSIMTARFARRLKDLGAEDVVIGLPRPLCRLFALNGFEVLALEDVDARAMARFDYHSPMYSAMLHMGIEWGDIDPRPYLQPPAVSVPPVYDGAFNVGICWASGKRGSVMDWRRRYAPLEHWLPLTEIPRVHVWSLMKGPEERDIVDLNAEVLIIDDTRRLDDWAATAAYVAQLDLVITVDTAVAHLAGAMGVPVWMISQSQPCWRWREIDQGSGRPWYNCMRVFRQPNPFDWKTPLLDVKRELEAAVRERVQ